MTELAGIYPILNTAFTEDGSLDLASQISLIGYLLESGARGLGVFGNAGEGYALTPDERRTLLQLIVREVNGRVPLVVSTGHTGTDAAVRLSREAEDSGAAALMILPPYFLRTDGEGLAHYYAAIGQAVKIPIMIQDAPLMTQVAMPPALLARLAREIERVEYVKVEAPPTAPKVSAILNQSPGLTVFGGLNGQFLIEEIRRGARGAMPGSDLIPEFVRIWNHLEAGEDEAAWRLFTQILPLARFELQPGMGVSAQKHNLAARGVIRCPRVRHPAVSLDRRSLAELAFLREWAARGPAR